VGGHINGRQAGSARDIGLYSWRYLSAAALYILTFTEAVLIHSAPGYESSSARVRYYWVKFPKNRGHNSRNFGSVVHKYE
jgi:hypothetical protein